MRQSRARHRGVRRVARCLSRAVVPAAFAHPLPDRGAARRPRQPGAAAADRGGRARLQADLRSEEHTSELQSLMRISYAVFCLKKKKYIITEFAVITLEV